ncbi:MAG: DUF4440 domain-containing protein [Gammaproteobacteria bacterium]|nr:DUF4440 domain-containing protein [Gammaproteobacteria bacterium]
MGIKQAIGVLAVLGVTLLAGCGSPADLSAQAAEEILAADHHFAELSRKGGTATAFRRYLAYDAIMLPDGGDVLKHKGIATWLDGVDYRLDWQPQAAGAAASGDYGHSWGYWQARGISLDGEPYVLEGKYLNVWRRNEDGEWKVLVDLGNKGPYRETLRAGTE